MQVVSGWLNQIADERHPYHQQIQAVLSGSLSYLGARVFTKIPPHHAAAVTFMTVAFSQTIVPTLSDHLEPYRDYTLVPLSGQLANLVISYVGANTICRLHGLKISFRSTPSLLASFLTAHIIVHFVIRRLRRGLVIAD